MAKKATQAKAAQTLRERIGAALSATHTVRKADLDLDRYPDEEKARAAVVATRRNAAVADLRAGAAVDQFRALLAERAEDNAVAVDGVTFASVSPIGDGGVDVRLGVGPGETHYRIFNPPTLVRDPAGPIEVRGQRYREDPMAALAEVIASNRPTRERTYR